MARDVSTHMPSFIFVETGRLALPDGKLIIYVGMFMSSAFLEPDWHPISDHSLLATFTTELGTYPLLLGTQMWAEKCGLLSYFCVMGDMGALRIVMAAMCFTLLECTYLS